MGACGSMAMAPIAKYWVSFCTFAPSKICLTVHACLGCVETVLCAHYAVHTVHGICGNVEYFPCAMQHATVQGWPLGRRSQFGSCGHFCIRPVSRYPVHAPPNPLVSLLASSAFYWIDIRLTTLPFPCTNHQHYLVYRYVII